jgi:hypothetical protein
MYVKNPLGDVSGDGTATARSNHHMHLDRVPRMHNLACKEFGCWLNHCARAFCTLTCNVNFRIFLNSAQQWQLHGSNMGCVTAIWEHPITWHLLVQNSCGPHGQGWCLQWVHTRVEDKINAMWLTHLWNNKENPQQFIFIVICSSSTLIIYFIHDIITYMFWPIFQQSSGWCSYYKNTICIQPEDGCNTNWNRLVRILWIKYIIILMCICWLFKFLDLNNTWKIEHIKSNQCPTGKICICLQEYERKTTKNEQSHHHKLYSSTKNITLKMAGIPAKTCWWKRYIINVKVHVTDLWWFRRQPRILCR